MSRKLEVSQLINETLIYDYVAGNLTESAKLNFEQQLNSDPALRDKVDQEIKLREAVTQDNVLGTEDTISDGNFEKLQTLIEQHERAAHSSEPSRKPSQGWYKGLSIAASLALFVMVGANYYEGLNEPKFITLSDVEESSKIDLNKLISDRKVASVSFADTAGDEQVSQFLSQFELNVLNASPHSGTWLLYSDSPIKNADIEQWSADRQVVGVELLVTVPSGENSE